jgi:P27 family predicted phage terminase small subunit
MAGRKRKPTHLHLVEGTLNVTRHKSRLAEPKPSGDLTTAPEWMDDAQRATWDYAIKHAPLGLLKHLDLSVLVTWTVACCLHRQAVEQIGKLGANGLLYKVPSTGSLVQSPLIGVANRQAAIMIKAASELGFTPTSRAKVSIDPNVQAEDPAEAFFG